MNSTHSHKEKGLWLFPVILSFAANANVLQNGFGWDDEVIVKNLRVPESWLQFFLPFFPDSGVPVSAFYYRPIVSLSYTVDYLIWGDNLFGFHLTVLMFHCLNVFLVYGLCRTLIGNSTLSYQPQSEWTTRYAPVLTAGFFAVHPLHAEAVAWIPGRNDVICATFVLVSFWVYVLSQHKRSRLVYFASMVLFFFALLSKEVAAGLLLIFPFYELVVRREGNKTKNLPSAVLRSVAFPVMIFGIYFWLRALKITGSNPSKALEGGESFPELGDIFSAAGYYFKSLAYPFPFRPFIAGLPGETGPAVFFALAWTGVLVWVFLRFPVWRGVLGIGVVWPWIFVVPALWVFISGVAATPLADRYAYIPSAGFLMASVILVLIGMDRIRSERMVILRKAGTGVLVASLGLMLVFWALENRERNTIWGSPLSFWRAAVISAPEAAYPKEQLGIFLGRAGKVNEAEESFKSALQLNPGPDRRAKILSNLGDLYSRQGRYQEAAGALRESLRHSPDNDEILWHLGELFFKLSIIEEVPEEVGTKGSRRVTRFDPVLFREGEAYFQRALALRPILFLYNRLGWKYLEFGDLEKAEDYFSQILESGTQVESELGRQAVQGMKEVQKERNK